MPLVSRQVLERLYVANNLKEIINAFRYRERIETRWDSIKNNWVETEIRNIDMKTKDWNATEVTKICKQMWDDAFNTKVR